MVYGEWCRSVEKGLFARGGCWRCMTDVLDACFRSLYGVLSSHTATSSPPWKKFQSHKPSVSPRPGARF